MTEHRDDYWLTETEWAELQESKEVAANWATASADLIDILGDDHDEEECDNLADLIEEVRSLITRLRREANGRPFSRLPNATGGNIQ